jgi:hypothetical protein
MSVAIVEDRVWQRERLTPEEAEVLAVELRSGSSVVVSQRAGQPDSSMMATDACF